MTAVQDLEQRLAKAFDRIGAGIDALSASTEAMDAAALQDALESERTANAQLEERVKALNAKQEDAYARIAELEAGAGAQETLTARIDELTAALEAAEAKAAAQPAAASTDPTEMADLSMALEQAQLDADTQAEALAEAQAELAREREARKALDAGGSDSAMREKLLQLDSELQRLRGACDLLRDQNEGLRTAAEKNVSAPHLINMSLMSELEALRAQRATDRAEIESVLSVLSPILLEAANNNSAAPMPPRNAEESF